MKTTKRFECTGLVFGNYWGGGSGAYKARSLKANSRAKLIKQAIDALNDSSLDSGMGYESLIGAILHVEIIETVVINGEEFSRSDFEIEFIGNLTEEQQEFLYNNL